jgi:hypothetical protein
LESILISLDRPHPLRLGNPLSKVIGYIGGGNKKRYSIFLSQEVIKKRTGFSRIQGILRALVLGIPRTQDPSIGIALRGWAGGVLGINRKCNTLTITEVVVVRYWGATPPRH